MTDQQLYREAKFQLEIPRGCIQASTNGADVEIAMARASWVLKEVAIFENGWDTWVLEHIKTKFEGSTRDD